MGTKRFRVLLMAAVVTLAAPNLFAPIQPDCNNQPTLQCGFVCTQNGCSWIVTPDDRYHDAFCYQIGSGTNCMGGWAHKCCS